MKTLIILFLLLPSFAFAQQQQIVSLDSFISKQVQDYKIPGLAIGIIKNGKVMFKKGYGITSTTDSVPVTTATVFPIMSCTKAFTAAAIGLLVDQGKVGWGDKVVHYLPDFKLSDTSITNELTIADILSHRSGLESYEGDLLWYGTSYSRQEIVKRIKYSAVRNRFRKDYGYQNVMYLVAGLVIEKVTGQSWDDFIEAKFFSPLSMKKSSTSIKEMVKAKSHAKPHLTSQPLALMNLDNIAPAGAINSTIDDLLNWLLLWIDKGMYKGKKLFSELTYDTITTEKIKVSSSSDESYGFGWNIGYANGKKVLAHGGGLPGFKSYAIIMPENKTGVVILTNKLTYLNEELAGIILNYLNGEETDWKNAEKNLYGKNFHFSYQEDEVAANTRKPVSIPNFTLYEGHYEDRQYGSAVIKEENGQAILRILPSEKQFSGPLYYISKERFKIVFKDQFVPSGEVTFKLDKNKKPVGFKLNIERSDFLFKYLEFKRIK